MGASQTVLPFKLAANGTEETHEMVNGHRPTNTISPEPIGLTLGDGKSILAANADPADFKRRPIDIMIIGGNVRIAAPVALSRTGALGN